MQASGVSVTVSHHPNPRTGHTIPTRGPAGPVCCTVCTSPAIAGADWTRNRLRLCKAPPRWRRAGAALPPFPRHGGLRRPGRGHSRGLDRSRACEVKDALARPTLSLAVWTEAAPVKAPVCPPCPSAGAHSPSDPRPRGRRLRPRGCAPTLPLLLRSTRPRQSPDGGEARPGRPGGSTPARAAGFGRPGGLLRQADTSGKIRRDAKAGEGLEAQAGYAGSVPVGRSCFCPSTSSCRLECGCSWAVSPASAARS